MKRELRSLAYVLALGVSMTALSLGGTAGCGSSGGGGVTTGSDDEAGEAAATIGDVALVAGGGSPASLILRSEQVGLKAQTECTGTDTITCDCAVSGSFTVDSNSIDFSNCSFHVGESINGSAAFAESGDSVTVTFSDFTFTDDDCGTFSVTGTVVGTELADGSADIDLDVDVEAGDSTFSLDCAFNSNDTCPDIADACGFSSSDVCEGDDFSDVSCE